MADVLRLFAGIAAMLVTLHCSHRPAVDGNVPAASRDNELLRTSLLLGYEAHFHITWNGARIGDAGESLRAHGNEGLRFERRERITVRRGDALAHSETDLVIDTDAELHARRIAVRQIASGALRHGIAQRNARGDWLVTYADEPPRLIPGATVPAELIPLMLAATPSRGAIRFDGAIMLPGYGFAIAHLRVEEEDTRHLLATLSTAEGQLRSRFVLGQGGTLVRVEGEDGSGAARVDAAIAAAPFEAPEIVDAASIRITRSPRYAAAPAEHLLLEPLPPGRPLPPLLPGQHIEHQYGAWSIRLSDGDAFAPPMSLAPYPPAAPGAASDAELERLAAEIIAESNDPGTERAEAFALVRATAALLADDLGAPAGNAHTALMSGRGDCTAHAVLFAALARARGIPVRLVTGFRVDGDRLVRHRWAIVAVDGSWIAVDPTYGEAPSSPRLLGLAVHGTRTAELTLADEVAFAGLSRIRAFACPEPELNAPLCGRSRLRTP